MAIPTKSSTDAAAKYTARAPLAGNDYKKGVESAGARWQQGVDDGDQAYASGVQQAISAGSYGRGVAGKSGKYVSKAVAIGVPRYAQGVQAASGDYQQAIGRVLGVISGITLPPRAGTGSPGNMQRAQMVADALHQAKLRGDI